MKSNSRPLFVGILILAQVACSLGGLQGAPTPTLFVLPTSGAPPDAAVTAQPPPAGDPRETVLAAFDRLNTAYPYRLTETTTDSATNQPFTRVAEFAGSNELHTTWTGVLGDGEYIETGGKSYWYSNGTWTETTEPPAGAESQFDMRQTFAEAVTSVQLVGPEATANGVATFAYTFEFVFQDANGTGKVWIGALDGLPYQADFDLNMNGVTANSHIVYEFGVPITITAPIP